MCREMFSREYGGRGVKREKLLLTEALQAFRLVSGSVRRAYGAGLQAFVLLQVHL